MGIIHYVLLVLILAAFIIAYFSARTWHWGQVLVVLGIFLSTLGFFVLAAETLRINAVLRKQINELNSKLTDLEARNDALRNGSDDASLVSRMQNEDPPVLVRGGGVAEDEASAEGSQSSAEKIDSLADLEHELLLQTRRRGRVWWGVMPAGAPQGDVLRISVPRPTPAGVQPESVVALFEAGEPQLPAPNGAPRGPQYLGQFRVTQADAQTATLESVLPLDNFERQRIAASRGPWIMHDTMPPDRYEVFAGKSEEALKQMLPPQSVVEYLRHGKEAGLDDDPARVIGLDADGKRLPPDQVAQAATKLYQRRLRDYALEFDEAARRRLELQVDIDTAKQDLERLAAAQTSAKELQAFREQDIQKLQGDLAGIKKERQAIDAHLAKLQQSLANGRRRLAETLRRNVELARNLAAQQQVGRNGAVLPSAAKASLALGTVH